MSLTLAHAGSVRGPFATFIVGYAIWPWQFYRVVGQGLGDARPGSNWARDPTNTWGHPNGSRSIGGKRRRTSQ